MAYVPNSGSVVAFQSDNTKLEVGASIIGLTPVAVTNIPSISGTVNIGNNLVASVAGIVGASIIGIPTVQTGNSSVITVPQGSVAAVIIGGSIAASFTPPANQSVSGTISANLQSTNASVISVPQGSIAAVIVGGSIAASFTPPANQSVSGTLGASIIGLPNVAIAGSVAAFLASTNASVITVGSPVANQSVSGTVGASVIGTVPVTQSGSWTHSVIGTYSDSFVASTVTGIPFMFKANISSSIMQAVSPTFPLPIIGSVSGSVGIVGNPSISGTVNIAGNPSVSGQLGASIIGQLPAGTAVLGSVAALQGTNPWNIAGSVATFQAGTLVTSVVSTVPSSVLVGASIFGRAPISIVDYAGAGIPPVGNGTTSVTTPRITIASDSAGPGSIISFQAGTNISSISGTVVIQSVVGTYAEDAASASGDPGIMVLGVRNDTIASLVNANGDYGAFAQDSAGRQLVKPFTPEEAVLRGNGSVNGVASVQLLAAAGTGLKTYMTDVTIANTGATTTLVTFTDGDASIIGRTVAPAGGGSNIVGLAVPMVTMKTNTPINMVAATATSVLYGAAQGYKAP